MIITLKIRTEPSRGGMGQTKAADHAEIVISDVQHHIQDRFPNTEIIGIEWTER